MEESKNFHSIKIIKIQNENDFKNKTDKFKINQKFNANIKNIINNYFNINNYYIMPDNRNSFIIQSYF